jgi:hydrogenase expression/formation protein HypD
MLQMNEGGIRYIDEYRDKTLIAKLVRLIRDSARSDYTFMEVCGGHTAAIHRFGIPSLLPSGIKLISGPGCPVCVTGKTLIDMAVAYSRKRGFIIATFGDLMRVPGSGSTLEKEKADGADVRVVFSGLEALEIAKANPGRKVIFPGIGFETTAPGTAVTLKKANDAGLRNFYILSSHKVMPPAMDSIINDGVRLDGFICPGHVATITGSSVFEFIPAKYGLGCVIAGFEPVDLLQSVYMLVKQVNERSQSVEIEYTRAVTKKGNLRAKQLIEEVFEPCDSYWRGFGIIPLSGLRLRKQFEGFDAEKVFPVRTVGDIENQSCLCGEILRGLKSPSDCQLFSTVCTPLNPEGACMVSEEGTCNAHYKYAQ